jgi:hypothetical protein
MAAYLSCLAHYVRQQHQYIWYHLQRGDDFHIKMEMFRKNNLRVS